MNKKRVIYYLMVNLVAGIIGYGIGKLGVKLEPKILK